MNILYTLNSAKPGGMEQHTLDLVKSMVERGHRVFVWCPQGDVAEWFRYGGALVSEVSLTYDIDPGYIFKLVKFLKDHQIDVVHAHELKATVNTLIAAKIAGTKVRVSHTHTPISTWQMNPVIRFLDTVLYSVLVNLLSTCEIALTE